VEHTLVHSELNQPWNFWQPQGIFVDEAEWVTAMAAARSCLGGLPVASLTDARRITTAVLSEAQFGPQHFRLSWDKRLYYLGRPILRGLAGPSVRRRYRVRQARECPLSWPIEDRYIRFLLATVGNVMRQRGLSSLQYTPFWPGGKRFALVLTHDVETRSGRDFVREVAALEERYGFRSSFNFVPELYGIDHALLDELCQRGFEVGVHGLNHDGHDFLSRAMFERRARRINHYLRQWESVGFRAPFTHRNPVWMQDLAIEYDSSFPDTDPYEPIAGGTMTIWPFFMGHFIELPYTLMMEHTMMLILRERTPRLWLEKVDFIRRHGGMALLNAHPDNLRIGEGLSIYEMFLAEVAKLPGRWDALPRDAARWWRERATGRSTLAAAEPQGARDAPRIVQEGAELRLTNASTMALAEAI
jgi:peptidoglycan/xylan/chitin deacetylase (PgdA/CDA1 family)